MGLVIKKKITLEFLGDEYKDAYLVFQSIPIADIGDIEKKMPDEDAADKLSSLTILLDILKKYFITGEFPNDQGTLEPVTREDIGSIDSEVAVHCFQRLTRSEANLAKGSGSSSTPSTQEDSPEEKLPSNT